MDTSVLCTAACKASVYCVPNTQGAASLCGLIKDVQLCDNEHNFSIF